MKKIAVLASGGNSQGMNTAVLGVLKSCANQGITSYVVYDGYRGLCANQIVPLKYEAALPKVRNKSGGIFIGSSRYPAFVDRHVKAKAVANLQKHEIDGLIVIGGNGSYQGAHGLTELGVHCIGVPGTVDNDISTTDFTIGFDTAANYILQVIDQVRDSAEAHQRCIVMEVMGRHCGDLAAFAGAAGLVDLIITRENFLEIPVIVEYVQACADNNARSVIVLVTENLYDVYAVAKAIEKTTLYTARALVLGHAQRGGVPTLRDRWLGFFMGVHAVKALVEGHTDQAVSLFDGKINLISFTARGIKKPRLNKHYLKWFLELINPYQKNNNNEK